MSIIIGIIVPALLFIITLPLQSFLFVLRQNLKFKEIQEKKRSKGSFKKGLGFSGGTDALRSRLGLSPSKPKSVKGKLNSKVHQLSLKAQQALIKGISMLISLLRSVASTLIGLAITAITMMLPICIAVIVGASSIVMFMGDGKTTTTYGNLISSSSSKKNSNAVSGGTTATSTTKWVKKCKELGEWYIKNINTYTGKVYPPNSPNITLGSRKAYSCDLLGGKNVCDDCSSYAYACLVYAGYIKGDPSGAPSVRQGGWAESSTLGSQLKKAGWKHLSVSSGFKWKTGDLALRQNHVELVYKVNGDKVKTFGWGTVRDSFPSGSYSSHNEFTSKGYIYCWRLKK